MAELWQETIDLRQLFAIIATGLVIQLTIAGKLHGYPDDLKKNVWQKGRGVAAAAQQTKTSTDAAQEDHSDKVSGNQNSNLDVDAQANLAGKFCLTTSLNVGWSVDSGATDHICTNLNMFTSFKELHGMNNTITILDGSKISVLHIGTVTLNGDIQLKNVQYVLTFKFNFLFVPNLCKDMKCKVLFTHDACFVQGHYQSSILLGKLHVGLYYVEDQKCPGNFSLSSNFHTSCNNTSWNQASRNATKIAELWHLRLGHLPFHNFKHVLPCHIKDCTDSILCKGPYKDRKYNGYNQFFTIVDDYTRYTWGEIILCAADLVNKMPVKSIQYSTPYQKLHNVLACIEHLRSFGCLCYYSTSKVYRSKFDARASPGVFIGYSLHQKGYKVLDLTTYKIHIIRDVVFHEHHLPFHFKDSNTTSPILFLPKYTTSHIDIPESPHTFSSPTEIHHHNTSYSSPESSHTDSSSVHSPVPSPVFVPINKTTSQVHPAPPLKKITRVSKEPSWMKDYKCYSSRSHWCNPISFNSLPAKSKSNIVAAAQLIEPISYLEAS
ncbi:uncharacterized protein LOC110739629 [Chenopodium quinoa]|uniref:uncharacterized protein LOC110739629 n=1 Tax=Chenopodium quinoa TaxID=63459 RepID=UPI000B77E2BF|nr:uncharacterized protein LOC110739629 [Chenopodium quinoa]